MILTLEERKNNPEKEKLYHRLLGVYSHIQQRTTNPNDGAYKNYGGIGVHLLDDWKVFANFIRDIDKINGWDENDFLLGNIELDKDLKIPGNKVYGKDTTLWVTKKDNRSYRPSRNPEFYAYNEYTGKLELWDSPYNFTHKYNLPGNVSGVLYGRKHRVGDWWLWLKDSPAPKIKKLYFKDTDGIIYSDVNARRLSLKIGKTPRYISKVKETKSPKGTEFWEEYVNIGLIDKIIVHKSSTTIERANDIKGIVG